MPIEVFSAINRTLNQYGEYVDYDNAASVYHKCCSILFNLLSHGKVDAQKKLMYDENVYEFKHDWQISSPFDDAFVCLRMSHLFNILREKSSAEVDYSESLQRQARYDNPKL